MPLVNASRSRWVLHRLEDSDRGKSAHTRATLGLAENGDDRCRNEALCLSGESAYVRFSDAGRSVVGARPELLREYPELEEEDIRQALEFAASALDDEIIDRGAA